MKVCFETFGCRLNRAEALQMEAEYLAKGWELTEKHADADLFVVRGCSVTRRAQRDCEALIEHLKKHYPLVPIRICGCLTVDAASSPRLKKEAPSLTRDKNVASPLPTRTARAYLKCQDGCSGQCTFCIVPKFRGSSVSVPFEELVGRARRFIDAGYHEIVLTGCNLALYAAQGKRLPDLVAALAELTPSHQPSTSNHQPSTCRIRIGSLEPGACALETVDAMAEHANVCRFLHIPVQSGSNVILSAMRRPYQVKDVEALVERVLGKVPLVGLGCDMMSGFPGETVFEHTASQGLLKRMPFSNVHVFPFSERPGTIAAGLPGALDRGVRHDRARNLATIGQAARERFARKFIGRDVEIVIENEEKMSGWTGEYFTCEITNKARLKAKRKDLVRVHVTDAHADRLKATVI